MVYREIRAGSVGRTASGIRYSHEVQGLSTGGTDYEVRGTGREERMSERRSTRRKREDRYVADGLCAMCGKKRNVSRRYCDYHLLLYRMMKRRQVGCGKHIKTGMGRPPLLRSTV